jgi:hypothetical protein
MLYCWNTFEIPALEMGLITALTPRIGMGLDVRVDLGQTGIPAGIRAEGSPAIPAVLNTLQPAQSLIRLESGLEIELGLRINRMRTMKESP